MAQEYNEKLIRSEYEALDRDFLYEVAKERGLKGLSKSTKPELIDALVAHDKGQLQAEVKTNPENQIPPPPEKSEPEAEPPSLAQPNDPDAVGSVAQPDPLAPNPTLADQIRRIRAASTEGLKAIRGNNPDLPLHLVGLIDAELAERAEHIRIESERELARTQIQRFRVTRGGRYVTKTGHITELNVGAVLSDKTHDLAHVRSQGIQIEPAERVQVTYDQLGKQISEAR